MKANPQYTKREELVHVVTHGLGIVLAIIGSVVLIGFSSRLPDRSAMVSSVIYGISMILMYTMSTVYHAASRESAKSVLRILDHASIFLLIAGSYTPITFILLDSSAKALILLCLVWTTAIVGIVINVMQRKRFKRVSMGLYLLMGWAILLILPEMLPLLGTTGAVLLIAGGISYTAGTLFYRRKDVKYTHGIWHLFVLAGSVLHYLCILRCVILA